VVAKTGIIDELGEPALLRPGQVNEALAANDRLKYRFTLLQAAHAHAMERGAPCPDLRVEREAAGVDDAALDGVVASSRLEDGQCVLPGAARIHDAIEADLRTMRAPLAADEGGQAFDQRLAQLLAAPRPQDDRLPAGYVGAITHARRERGDSLHLLVMDMHKALNAVQASIACESLDGAQVYAIADEDRALVRAFMAGLNATAPLKFDHPGLGTTATRSHGALVIQNDIGTTDAHVLVVHVRDLAGVITYTDIHPRRASFFKSLFDVAGVQWEEDRARRAQVLPESDSYVLCTGRFEAPDAAALARKLEFLGSRIVFLIDWNKARKRLRQFMRTRDVVDVLTWAARNDHGHRAFLELGGERLIYDALENAGTVPIRYGERLDRLLGRDTLIEHIKFVLRTTAQGLLESRTGRLIRDEIKADLMERLHTTEQGFFALLADHAALSVDLAGVVRDGLMVARSGGAGEQLEVAARRAKLWETRADELVVQVREGMPHAADRAFFASLAHEADDVADNLEEAAGLLPLLPAVAAPAVLFAPLERLAQFALESSQRLASCLESARHVQRGGAREDLRDFLEAVDQLITLEHETDRMEREVTLALVSESADHRQLHLLSLIGKRLEQAADAGARSGLMLRDHVMGQVMPR